MPFKIESSTLIAALALADSSSFSSFASTLIAQETRNKPDISNTHRLFPIHAFFEHDRLLINQFLKCFLWQIIQLHFKLKWLLSDGLLTEFQTIKHRVSCSEDKKAYLISWVIVLLQVRVGQRVFDDDSFVRVERQHLVQ